MVALTLAVCVRISRVGLKALVRGLKPVLFIIVFTGILNLFFTPGTRNLVEWGFLHISDTGLHNAIFMVLRIMLLIMGTFLMTYTTSPISLTDGLERLLGWLKRFRVPVHELAMMMSIALRFIPTLIEETDKIMSAQKARGADFERRKSDAKGQGPHPAAVPLFISASAGGRAGHGYGVSRYHARGPHKSLMFWNTAGLWGAGPGHALMAGVISWDGWTVTRGPRSFYLLCEISPQAHLMALLPRLAVAKNAVSVCETLQKAIGISAANRCISPVRRTTRRSASSISQFPPDSRIRWTAALLPSYPHAGNIACGRLLRCRRSSTHRPCVKKEYTYRIYTPVQEPILCKPTIYPSG